MISELTDIEYLIVCTEQSNARSYNIERRTKP